MPNGSCSISDIQNYLKYITKKYDTVTDNLTIMIYVDKVENRITFKIKTRHYLEILIPKTMKLLGGTESKITKTKNWRICSSFKNY